MISEMEFRFLRTNSTGYIVDLSTASSLTRMALDVFKSIQFEIGPLTVEEVRSLVNSAIGTEPYSLSQIACGLGALRAQGHVRLVG